MTIGIDASRAIRAHKTGTEWYSYYLIRELATLDTQNQYIVYVDTDVPKDFFSLPQNFSFKKLRWPLPFFWTQGRLSLEMLFHPPGILFIPSHAIPIIHPKNTVTTVHDIGFFLHKGYVDAKNIRYLEWSTQYALKQCKKIITISQYSKDEIVKLLGRDPGNIEVIYLGYDTSRYTQPREEDRQSAQVTLGKYNIKKPFLFSIGRIDARKNLLTLLQAFEALKKDGWEGDLVLAGTLGYHGRDIIEACKKSICHDSIQYLGWLSEEEKIHLLYRAECFVFPSVYEGFGLPILEAQSCGVPVVCSNTSSFPEVAGTAALFFDPHSSDDLKEKIFNLVSNHDLRTSLVAHGFENVKRFSWRKTAEETLSFLLKD